MTEVIVVSPDANEDDNAVATGVALERAANAEEDAAEAEAAADEAQATADAAVDIALAGSSNTGAVLSEIEAMRNQMAEMNARLEAQNAELIALRSAPSTEAENTVEPPPTPIVPTREPRVNNWPRFII